MNTLKRLEQRLIDDAPRDPESQILERLVKALCLKEDFKLAEIYELGYDDFELALGIMKNWRLGRYTKTKERLKAMVCTSVK